MSASAQCADSVVMIRPAAFGANPLTAESNRFQQAGHGADIAVAALSEFDRLADTLAGAGVRVTVLEDSTEPPKPDACFPNNWVSLHGDGTAVLYPMMAANRRAERRPELLEQLQRQGFRIRRTLDLSDWESRDEFLEGTGSLVLDRAHRIAYACRSPRTCAGPLAAFATDLGYRNVVFDAFGAAGEPAYHTNVLMCIGERFVVLCVEAIAAADRDRVVAEFETTGHQIVTISKMQMGAFAGNMLALRSVGGEPLVLMSAAALESLDADQRRRLERHGAILAAAIPTIEKHGGGSVRCMLAENFLPR